MCHTGRPLVADGVAGEAEKRPIVVSWAGLVGDPLLQPAEAPVGLPGHSWELDELLKNDLNFII